MEGCLIQRLEMGIEMTLDRTFVLRPQTLLISTVTNRGYAKRSSLQLPDLLALLDLFSYHISSVSSYLVVL
jgi:hypothetical protein